MNLKNWAASLAVAMLAAGCGGDGGSDNASQQVSISISPSSAALSAATTDKAPTATLALSTVEGPNGRLTVVPTNGKQGYANATFDGSNVVVTGEAPSALAAGTYQDTISVKVCYDAQCTSQVTNSPITVPVTYTVTQGDPAVATPAITALSPSSVSVGSADFPLTVSGNNFTQTSVVLWNGQPLATTYVAAATLSAQIPAADVAALTTAKVTVSNAASGGGVSTAQSFSVAPVIPAITALSPATATVGGSDYTLTVTGTGFDSSASVIWNGSPAVTTFVSSTKVTAVIPATDIAKAGNFPVRVWNSDGSPNASAAVQVGVVAPVLSLGSLLPPFVTAGGAAYVETLNGTGFTATSVAQWNGSPRVTTFVSTSRLQMQVTAADIATAGTASLTVVDNASTPAAASGALTLTIGANTASIDATAFQVNPQHNGAARFANIVAAAALPTTPTWSITLDGTGSYPVIAGGRVFLTEEIAYNQSELVALNAASGAVAWGPIAIGGNSALTYDNGRVFVMSNDVGSAGIMTAYDASSGTQLWTTTLPGQYQYSAPPTALNGLVYVGGAGSGGTLYALNEATGTIAWTASVENGDDSSPTVTANGVYVSYPCQTYGFNPITGSALWHDSEGCEGGGGATGAWANGLYYSPNGVSGYGGMTFDATSGSLITSYSATQPVAIGTSIGYFLQNAKLSAIGLADNSIQWTFTGDGTLTTAPLLVNSYVFVGSGSGKLYVLDASTGAQLSVIALPGAPNTSNLGNVVSWNGMNAGDGLLVVPTGNQVSAFTLSTNP